MPHLLLTLILTLFMLCGSAFAADSVKISVGSVTAKPGQEVTIPVSISNNTGVAGIALDFTLASGVELQSITAGDVLSTGTFTPNGTVVSWFGNDNITANGVLMNIKVKAPSKAGSYSVSAALRNGKASSICDEDSRSVAVTFAAGTLKVEDTTPTKVDLSKCTVTLSKTSYTYDGNAKTPTVTVKNGNTTLTKDTDYTVVYKNNTEVGTATVTVTGKGNYTGSKSATFQIIKQETPSGDTFVIEDGKLVQYNGKATNVVIPAGVTTIGESAFYSKFDEGTNVSVTLPNGVTTIEDNAFRNNPGLTKINLPNGLTRIGENAFYDCGGLTSVDFPDSLSEVGFGAFYYCSGLTSIVYPSNITDSGGFIFSSCTGLKKVTLPNGLKKIDFGAFSGCTGLTSITIPGSVKDMEMAFDGCTGLRSVTLSEGITEISSFLFSHCTSLSTIAIPATVTDIGGYAFDECSALTSIFFKGNAPSFSGTCFTQVKATAIYPYNNASWTDKVRQNYGGTITWTTDIDATKKTQKITASSVTKVLGDKAFNLNAKTSGNGKLTYKSDNTKVATVSSAGKITLKGIGKATITITAASTDTYRKATKTVNVTVKKPAPKKPILSTVTNVKGKKLKITWKKVSKGITGYQIQYSTSKSFKKPTSKKVKDKSKTSATYEGLKKKKKYYVRIRTYKMVNKKDYYSGWSKVKNVTIKK